MERPEIKQKDLNLESLIAASDVAVDPESNLAVVIIKPDAFKNEKEIIRRLENSGLAIVEKRERLLPENFVISRSKGFPPDIEEEVGKHLTSGPSEIVLLRGGNDIVRKFVEVAGLDTDPQKCDEESLRFLFGEHFIRETKDGGEYFRNAIHRPKNERERLGDPNEFRDL